MGKRIEIIDFIKGFSIMTIVVMHYLQRFDLPEVMEQMIRFGGTGIHAFIFISGFGLYLSHQRKPLPYVQFLRKRLIKIYIPYAIAVLLIAAADLWLHVYDGSWYQLASHLFLFKMFDEELMSSYGYHLWFISTIIQFYAVFPVFIWLKETLGGKGLVFTSVAISIAWGLTVVALGNEELRIWNSFFLQYFWEFALGIFCADLFSRTNWAVWDTKWLPLLGATGVGLVAYALLALKFGDIGKVFNDYPALIGYLGITIVLYRIGIAPLNQFLMWVGGISFAFYLFHFVVLDAFDVLFVQSGMMEPNLIWLVGGVALTLFASVYIQQGIGWLYRRFGI